ncbi:MAG: hypothetical protein R2881_05640 [Eubacteriales bacterium]
MLGLLSELIRAFLKQVRKNAIGCSMLLAGRSFFAIVSAKSCIKSSASSSFRVS